MTPTPADPHTAPAPTALVTGSAGFIGFHVSRRLLSEGWRVVGLDAITKHGGVGLKRARHDLLAAEPGFERHEGRLETPGLLADLFAQSKPEVVIHLAAQAGVRHSIDAPRDFITANLTGTAELLEAARAAPPRHMLMASSSSVYGGSTIMPYRETAAADQPMSLYAATKKATEGLSHSYAHLFGIPVTMFRFFTVYGPWGRPDMALFKFTKAVLAGEPIDIYNHGDLRRDFTYVDDLVEGIIRLIGIAPPTVEARGPAMSGDTLSDVAPWRVVNIGNGSPVALLDFVAAIEAATGRTAIRRLLPMQPGDVPATWASSALIEALAGPLPRTDITTGVARFVDWYRLHHGV